MNFIASVLLTVLEKEEWAFWVFLDMLITRDMKTLFLPVIINYSNLIGCSRTSFKKFPNGLTYKVSFA